MRNGLEMANPESEGQGWLATGFPVMSRSCLLRRIRLTIGPASISIALSDSHRRHAIMEEANPLSGTSTLSVWGQLPSPVMKKQSQPCRLFFPLLLSPKVMLEYQLINSACVKLCCICVTDRGCVSVMA